MSALPKQATKKSAKSELPGTPVLKVVQKPLEQPARNYREPRPTIRIMYQRNIVDAYVGLDGCVWIDCGANGQKVISGVEHAREFLMARALDEAEREKVDRLTSYPLERKAASPIDKIAVRNDQGRRA